MLYLNKGKLREYKLDNDNEPFTTRIYEEGDFVGFDHLLRKEKISIIASTDIEGVLLKAIDFLKLCIDSKKFLDYFSRCFPQEFFYIIKKNKKINLNENSDLLKLSKEKCIQDLNSISIYPGDNYLEKNTGKYLVSSDNFKNYQSEISEI